MYASSSAGYNVANNTPRTYVNNLNRGITSGRKNDSLDTWDRLALKRNQKQDELKQKPNDVGDKYWIQADRLTQQEHLNQSEAQLRKIREEGELLKQQHNAVVRRLEAHQQWAVRTPSAVSGPSRMQGWLHGSTQWNNVNQLPQVVEEKEILSAAPSQIQSPVQSPTLKMLPTKVDKVDEEETEEEPQSNIIDPVKSMLYPDNKEKKKAKEKQWKRYGSHSEYHGPQNYSLLQLENYHMVRSIVYEIVDNFLVNYTPPNDQKKLHMSRVYELRRAMTIERVSQLLMEEIVLEAPVSERRRLKGAGIGGAEMDEQVYRSCKLALEQNRQSRSSSWSHILPLTTLPREFDLSAID